MEVNSFQSSIMSEQPIDSFLTVDKLKLMLKVTDDQNDNQLEQFVNDANAKVQTAIFRFVDKTPIGAGSSLYSRCGNAALAWARSLHAIDIQLIEKSKIYIEQYNLELYGAGGTEGDPMAGGLIQEIIATRTSRTKTVMITHDPREDKVPLPCQNDLFVSERFG